MAKFIRLALASDTAGGSAIDVSNLLEKKETATNFLKSNLFQITDGESLIPSLNLDSCILDNTIVELKKSHLPHFIILREHSRNLAKEEFNNFVFACLKSILHEFGSNYYEKVPVYLIWNPCRTDVCEDTIYLRYTCNFLNTLKDHCCKLDKRNKSKEEKLINPNSHSVAHELFYTLIHQKNTDGYLWTLLLSEVVPLKYTLQFLRNTAPQVLDVMLGNMKHYSVTKKNDLYYNLQQYMPVSDALHEDKFDQLEILLKHGHEKYTRDYVSLFPFEVPEYSGHTFTSALGQLPYLLFVFEYISEKKDTNGVKLLWRAFPFSIPPAKELYWLLTIVLGTEFKSHIKFVCDTYAENFPSTKLQPRSLQHYARCVIRKCLNNKFKLPEGIKELNIPQTCQNYLLLKF